MVDNSAVLMNFVDPSTVENQIPQENVFPLEVEKERFGAGVYSPKQLMWTVTTLSYWGN